MRKEIPADFVMLSMLANKGKVDIGDAIKQMHDVGAKLLGHEQLNCVELSEKARDGLYALVELCRRAGVGTEYFHLTHFIAHMVGDIAEEKTDPKQVANEIKFLSAEVGSKILYALQADELSRFPGTAEDPV